MYSRKQSGVVTMLDDEKIKEIANRYGIGIEPAENGEGGYIDDETGIVKDTFLDGIFNEEFLNKGE